MFDETEKRFKFCDDLMFSSVLSDDPVLVKQMLETILEHSIGNIVTMNVQEVLNYSPDAKSVQLDVYCKDDRSTLFDLEMENRKNRESLKAFRSVPDTTAVSAMRRSISGEPDMVKSKSSMSSSSV